MKVLLVRFSSLGDVVLATAAVEALGQDVPGAEIHVLTKPAFREVFDGNPRVTRVPAWSPAEGLPALARRVREESYDWVIDLHANLRTRLLRGLVPGARWSVYAKGSVRRRLAVFLRRPGLLGNRHVVDRYVEALGGLGVSGTRRLPVLHPGLARRERMDGFLAEQGWDGKTPLVALAPGARWHTKAWPRERWGDLLAQLEGVAGVFPVLLGGSEEVSLCRGLLANARGRGASLAGRTSLLETAAVLERCRALVTNDSAPLHVAAATRTPAVCLFGPTVPGFGFFPLGERDTVIETNLGCRPCSLHGDPRCPKGHHRCLVDVDALRVFDRVRAILSGGERVS